MSFDLWLAFTLAAALLIAIPGPTNLLVVAYTLQQGKRAGLATVFGVLPGIATSMLLSFAGLGAVLAASAEAFLVMKWIGAAYLIYLGIRQWRAPVTDSELTSAAKASTKRRMLREAFLVTLLNPKGIVFFSAFFPQFLNTGEAVAPQMAMLGATFLLLVLPINTGYALTAEVLRNRLSRADWRRALNRAGGALLVGAGLLTLSLRRS